MSEKSLNSPDISEEKYETESISDPEIFKIGVKLFTTES